MDSKVNKEESTDEVDFVPTKKEICVSCKSFNPLKKGFLMRNSNLNNNNHTPKTFSSTTTTTTKKTSVYGDCEIQTAVKSHISALERLHLFHFPSRKKSGSHEKLPQVPTKEQRPRLIKSSSIARLFGNTYSTKKTEEDSQALKKSSSVSEKFSNKAKRERRRVHVQDERATHDTQRERVEPEQPGVVQRAHGEDEPEGHPEHHQRPRQAAATQLW